jgi:hypothetical protein
VRKRRQLNGGQKYKKYSQRPQNNNRSTAKTTTQPRKRFRRLRPGQRRHYLIHPTKNADGKAFLKPNLRPRKIDDADLRLLANEIQEVTEWAIWSPPSMELRKKKE